MNKRDLIDAIAQELGDDVSKQQVERTVDAYTRVVGNSLRKGEPVQLVGFGTFEPRQRSARQARNPQTGEVVTVPATTTPAFKAGQSLKAYVAGQPGAADRFRSRTTAKRTTKAAGTKAAGKKAVAKKSGVKKAGKAAGKKAVAKKSGVKKAGKAAAKKSAAKKSAKATKKATKRSR